jgi:protein-tyrosine kinase
MGRVLEALERARREREKRIGSAEPEGHEPPSAQVPAAPEVEPTEPPPPTAGNGHAEPAAEERYEFQTPRFEREATTVRLQRTALATGISERVVGAHDAQSPITEQVRQIRTNLETVLSDYRSRSIVVTSPVSGDGKTLVTANLTTVLADNPEHQVLLIDADMRKPDQHTLFGVRPHPGLSDFLRERNTLDEVIQSTDLPNLKVISAGHPPQNPTVLLSSDRMIAALGEMQRTFHWIVIDTPPLLPVTDASVIARECVGLILVVRMGQTPQNVIARSQELLVEQRLPVLGCILNDFSSQTRGNEYYYRYYRRNGDAPRG